MYTHKRERERERKSFVMFSYVVYIYTLRDFEVGTESQECYSCDIRSDIQTTYITNTQQKRGQSQKRYILSLEPDEPKVWKLSLSKS